MKQIFNILLFVFLISCGNNDSSSFSFKDPAEKYFGTWQSTKDNRTQRKTVNGWVKMGEIPSIQISKNGDGYILVDNSGDSTPITYKDGIMTGYSGSFRFNIILNEAKGTISLGSRTFKKIR